MIYSPVKEIKVGLNLESKFFNVGRLAYHSGKIYFEYDREFLSSGLEISPLKLPLQPGLKTFDPFLFEGLPGVFNDSLPDGWGRLLFDRSTRAKCISLEKITPLDRLAYVGNAGTGALSYEPDYGEEKVDTVINLDLLASHVQGVLEGEADGVLQELLILNGSSAGARPKAMIGVDKNYEKIIHGTHALPEGFTPWIVKFPNTTDGKDAGAIEYVYSIMAKNAGLKMTDTHLFPSGREAGFFATRRFDREGENRLHVHTACGLINADFRTPSLDYEDLLALTEFITKDMREVEKMFRLAVFNVLAHNRDDHSKNFSFLMNAKGNWLLSPAYDLTFSSGSNGEQSTMVLGEGKNPGIEHLTKLGEKAKINKKSVSEIILQTRESLSQWENLAKDYGVSKAKTDEISSKLKVKIS